MDNYNEILNKEYISPDEYCDLINKLRELDYTKLEPDAVIRLENMVSDALMLSEVKDRESEFFIKNKSIVNEELEKIRTVMSLKKLISKV